MSAQLNFRELLSRAIVGPPIDGSLSMCEYIDAREKQEAAEREIKRICSPTTMLAVVEALESVSSNPDEDGNEVITADTDLIDRALRLLSPEQKTEGKDTSNAIG